MDGVDRTSIGGSVGRRASELTSEADDSASKGNNRIHGVALFWGKWHKNEKLGYIGLRKLAFGCKFSEE